MLHSSEKAIKSVHRAREPAPAPRAVLAGGADERRLLTVPRAWRARSSASDAFDWGALSHEHLLTCEACRALLEQEQALDQLLASRRADVAAGTGGAVLARLERSACRRSERGGARQVADLLTASVPQDCGRRAGVSCARRVQREERALERLLDRVPAPEVPADLNVNAVRVARATTARAALDLQPMAARATPVRRPRAAAIVLTALAAAALLTIGLTALWLPCSRRRNAKRSRS